MSLFVMIGFTLMGLSSAFVSGLTGLAGGVLLLSCPGIASSSHFGGDSSACYYSSRRKL